MLLLSNQSAICSDPYEKPKAFAWILGVCSIATGYYCFNEKRLPTKSDLGATIGLSSIVFGYILFQDWYYEPTIVLKITNKMTNQEREKLSDCALLWDKSLVDLDNLQNCINGKEYHLTAEPSYEDDTD